MRNRVGVDASERMVGRPHALSKRPATATLLGRPAHAQHTDRERGGRMPSTQTRPMNAHAGRRVGGRVVTQSVGQAGTRPDDDTRMATANSQDEHASPADEGTARA